MMENIAHQVSDPLPLKSFSDLHGDKGLRSDGLFILKEVREIPLREV